MELKYGRSRESEPDRDNHRHILNKLKSNVVSKSSLNLDKRIHDEFLDSVKKDLDSKAKTTETGNIGKFKKWYKMAYPDKYKSSKSGLSSSGLTPNKHEKVLFSPDQSLISHHFNFNESNIIEGSNVVSQTASKFKRENNAYSQAKLQGLCNTVKPVPKGNSSSHLFFEQKRKDSNPNVVKNKLFSSTSKGVFPKLLNNESPTKKENPQKIKNNNTINSKSQAEIGLRKYYTRNKKKFLSRLQKGPPENFRWTSWLISLEVPEHRSDDQYLSLLSQSAESFIETQIEKDLHRTLTDDNLFKTDTHRQQLFNVLKAFAVTDKSVAYCQGMNCVAGFILVVSDYNEVDAFYLMLSLFSYSSGENNHLGVRGFYLPEFPLLQLYLYQFDYIFYKKMPNLKKHFENLGIPNEAWVSKWFQTLYTICLPLDVVRRLWDCIFAVGLEFLFNFTLAILKHFEEDLIKFNDMIDLSEYLKSMNPYLNKKENKQKLDIEKIIEEGKKIVIPRNVLDNLRSEYEKLYNLDLNKIQMKYSIKESTCHTMTNQQNLNDSISFGDCSFIDLANTKGKDSTINLCFNGEEQDNSDIFDASVSSELGDFKKEMKISEKVNNHILKLADMKKAPVIVRQSSKSVNKNIKIVASLTKNENKNTSQNVNFNISNPNTNSTNAHSTNTKSFFEGN